MLESRNFSWLSPTLFRTGVSSSRLHGGLRFLPNENSSTTSARSSGGEVEEEKKMKKTGEGNKLIAFCGVCSRRTCPTRLRTWQTCAKVRINGLAKVSWRRNNSGYPCDTEPEPSSSRHRSKYAKTKRVNEGKKRRRCQRRRYDSHVSSPPRYAAALGTLQAT